MKRSKKLTVILASLVSLDVISAIPEPGNLVSGQIIYNGQAVTDSDTFISLTLQDGTTVLDTYTMGDEATGGYYLLEAPMEIAPSGSQDPVSPGTVSPGDVLDIFLSSALVSGVNAGSIVVGLKGTLHTLNVNYFNDSDGDGMPDEWEIDAGLNPADSSDADGNLDGDWYSNLDEFNNGTDPNSLDFTLGDLNGDEVINLGDLIILNRSLLGLETLSAVQEAAANISQGDGLGVVNIADLISLQRNLLDIDS